MALKNEQPQGGLSKGRRFLNSIWVVLVVVSFTMLIGTAFGQMNELSAVQWGQSFVADYHDEDGYVYAEYVDENNVVHKYNLNGHSPIYEGDKITMYYTTNIDDATPQNTFSSFLIYYAVFGVIFMVSMWKLRKLADSVPSRA